MSWLSRDFWFKRFTLAEGRRVSAQPAQPQTEKELQLSRYAPFERSLRGFNPDSPTLRGPEIGFGHCLAPEIPPGSFTWSDSAVTPQPGDFVAATGKGQRMVKRLEKYNGGQFILTSSAPPVLVDDDFVLETIVRIEFYGVDPHPEITREVDALNDRLNATYALYVQAAQRGQRVDRVSMQVLLRG